MKKKGINKFKIVFWIIAAIAFILFYIEGYYSDKKAQKAFVEKSYNGVIKEILNIRGNRGSPMVKIDNQWIIFGGNEQKIQNYIKLSDSIVKDSGTETIKVYRKNFKGIWNEKVFN